jgi:phosphoribosylanthranilate isomerase
MQAMDQSLWANTRLTRVKICCIASRDEARLAVCAGAAAIGLVSEMPSGPGPIPEPLIREIAAEVPPPVATFLLTCHRDVREVIAQQRRCGTSVVQLCDRLTRGTWDDLRDALPGIRIVQVVHVADERSIGEAEAAAPHVDALLLDSGRPEAPIKELGGTGRVHDWALSRRIRDSIAVPVFLAGGLRPENVAEAVKLVAPFAVDVCSGVRVDGRLDPERLSRFMAAVAGAAPGSCRPVS